MNEYIKKTYIKRVSAWAPGVECSGEWDEWALGKRCILPENKSPDLSYTSSSFRRRLSQISKMCIQVVHDLLPLPSNEETKILFSSFRGELVREYQLFKMWKEDGEVSPAAFSLSGFNTPVALASIAFNLKGGYSALFPVKNSFNFCIEAALAALHSGFQDDLVLLYADENIPPECMRFFSRLPPEKIPQPAAFGLILSKNESAVSVPLSSINFEEDSPFAFLKQILLKGILRVNHNVKESN